ncbi:CPCC family cysteine-rich protein [Dictyobacter kobayashii]|uniref:Cysteine-rich CPCC domain-containing protein n=1 Tax=Dictyobacter kobayashii TaxID=2014872 RepID=A0A402AYG9_9CHLR|nr:CPCC family cysteine-rich protein [Dictyobacter kobayashii]GCE24172.1 hypothetical protein KDK_79720 [Dictyobacter kobayashii]
MTIAATSTFSEEDHQLSAANQLGTPLSVYIKPGSKRDLLITILTEVITGIILLSSLLNDISRIYHIPLLWKVLYSLFFTCLFGYLIMRQEQERRVIICEHGLLEIIRMIGRKSIKVVLWQDVVEVSAAGTLLTYRADGRKKFASFMLDDKYQYRGELIASIAEHKQQFGHAGILRELTFPKPEDGGKYRCPCCGFRTLNERGEYEICVVCYWQDDGQRDVDANINRSLSPNHMSLALARENYHKFGAIHKNALASVRPPLPEEL